MSWNLDESSTDEFIWLVTVCPHRRVDEIKLQKYLENNLALFPNETMQEKIKIFIQSLATISYETMDVFPLDITSEMINPETYLELMSDLKWEFLPEISSGTSNKLIMMRTVTENGICDAVNSKVSFYQSFEYWRENRWDILKPNTTVVVHPFDGEIYAQLTNLSTSYDVFVHGAMEGPDISRQKYYFPETDYTTVEFLALEILTSEDAKKFENNLKPIIDYD